MNCVTAETCERDAFRDTCISNGNFKYHQNVSPELRGARVTLELLNYPCVSLTSRVITG